MILLSHIDKTFGTTQALCDVSLAVGAGTVHGLLGENGAGKSTLMHILFGMLQPDAGSISIAEKPVRMVSPHRARALGIGMVHQHFKLVPTLSVLDNLVLALIDGIGVVDRAALRRLVTEQADALRWPLDLDARIADLPVGQQQRVEILKALCRPLHATTSRRVLILDEPTAVLTPEESAQLMSALRSLVDDRTGVILISHKLAEIEQACDLVTILRKGRCVHTGDVRALTRAQMTSLVLGEARSDAHRSATSDATQLPVHALARSSIRDAGPARTCCLRLSDVQVIGRDGGTVLDHAYLQVDAGEIVAIAGVAGNGQEELVDLILGLTAPASGTVTVIAQRRHLGVIPEDRQTQALVMQMSVVDNLLLKGYDQPPFSHWGWIHSERWNEHARTVTEAYDIRAGAHTQTMEELSGGNQQKAVLARELQGHPALILAHNPTRGLDIGATAVVFEQLRAARARGAGVLLLHNDLDEMLALADRVMVLCAGRLQESTWPEGGRLAVGRLMVAGAGGAT